MRLAVHTAPMYAEQGQEFGQLRWNELKAARAWALKEIGLALYEYVYEKPTRKHFHWYDWAVRSRMRSI